MTRKGLLTRAVLASSFFVTPLVSATTIGPGQTVVTQQTTGATNNTIEVLPTGQILTTDLNAVNVNSTGGIVQVDANNTFAGTNAIETMGGAAQAIAVDITSPNAIVTVGAGSGINAANTIATSDGILINAAGANITNTGTIQSADYSAIHIEGVGVGGAATVTNNGGAIIQNSAAGKASVILVDVAANSPLLTLNNSGTIQSLNAARDAIQLNEPFASITNFSGGVIQQMNAGVGDAIEIGTNAVGAGSITNNAGGIIQAAGTGNAITNGVGGATTGNITNAGTISATGTGDAIKLNANVNAINNTGTINANDPATGTIFNNTAGTIIAGGLNNSGNITSQTNGTNAIDFMTNATQATITQTAGMIVGHVGVADKATGAANIATNAVFNMSGGMLIGGINTPATTPHTFNLSGGSIVGPVILGNTAGDTVNLSGTNIITALTGGTGADTFNVTGGNFGSLAGGGGADTLNVNATFNPNGAISAVPTINVNNAGTTFTVSHPITGLNTMLTINAGTTMAESSSIAGTGDIENFGTFAASGTPTVTLTGVGTFTNEATGVINLPVSSNLQITAAGVINDAGSTVSVGIAGPGQYGQLHTTTTGTNTYVAGSFIAPQVQGFIPAASTYNVINSTTAAIIDDGLTVIQPNSATVTFTKVDLPTATPAPGPYTTIQLVASRNTFASLSGSQVTQGVAGALDNLASGNGPTNPDLLNLLGQLDQVSTQAGIENALESLAPPFNYGLVEGSYLGMDNVFSSVMERVEDVFGIRSKVRHASINGHQQVAYNGLNYGDPAASGSAWAQILGSHIDQKRRHGVPGYKANAGGASVGVDYAVNRCTTLGLAGSYTKVSVKDKAFSPKDESIKGYQGTLYGWFDFTDGFYANAMLGAARNRYRTNREINLPTLTTAAQARFDGTQYGAQGDLGWVAIDDGSYFLSPYARLKYIHLRVDDYTENGAGGLNLTVANNKLHEFTGGLGVRLGTLYEVGDTLYVPELTAMIAYDFENKGEVSSAGFAGGGPAFTTNGIRPGRTIFDLGLGLNAHITDNQLFTIKYDLELRNKYVGNTGMIQYNYFWS